MRARFVNELSQGSVVDAPYAVRSKEVRTSRAGETYLALELADRTGVMRAAYFGHTESDMTVPVGSVARVRGRVTTFKGVKRITVDHLEPCGTYDAGDIIARSVRDSGEMIGEFGSMVRTVNDRGLRAVLRGVFGDKELFARFCECPASQAHHHACIGGLLEHTVSVAHLCHSLADRYTGLDLDLLVAAALLHDVGKIDELDWSSSIQLTDQGRLLGHVVLGANRVGLAAKQSGLSGERAAVLIHAVLSHHGELEWGSPKRPSTLEALLLHHVDNLDAKADGMSSLIAGAVRAQESWTDASNLFRRPLHAPRSFEDDRPIRSAEEDLGFPLSA